MLVFTEVLVPYTASAVSLAGIYVATFLLVGRRRCR